MKAYTFTKYGAPKKVLELKNVNKPTPSPKQVLVKIRATSINDYDWAVVTGKPKIYQFMFGVGKPRKKLQMPGMELSGTVEAVGSEVSRFKSGDDVYGDTSDHGFGTFAEYISIDERALVKKPSGMSFTEATAIPHASMLALQGLRLGKIQDGQQVLINGGGGGVGTLGLQIAKLYNTEVTGVDSESKLKAMKDLGYDHVLDYRKTDFTKNGIQYDLILDCKTTRTASAYKRALKPNGRYVSIGGEVSRLIGLLLSKSLVTAFGNKKMHILALKANKDLDYISKLYNEGKIHCLADGPYPFEKIPWAIQYFGEARHTGKVVIEINSP